MSQTEYKKPFRTESNALIKIQIPLCTSSDSWWRTRTIAMYKGWLIFENIPDYIIDKEIQEISGYDYESLEKRRQIWVLFKMTDRKVMKNKLGLIKVLIYAKHDPKLASKFTKYIEKNIDNIIGNTEPWTRLYLLELYTELKSDNINENQN